jgi:hypothetical protein
MDLLSFLFGSKENDCVDNRVGVRNQIIANMSKAAAVIWSKD